jgi:predicted double-glycine peptidase
MDNDDQNYPGTGGGLRYLNETTTFDMVGQERLYSCQVACVRQLLRDAGVDLSEQELLKQIGYFEGWGTTSADAALVLDSLHPTLGFVGGAVDPDSLQVLFTKGSWIASMRTNRGTIHAVIVDKLIGHVVTVRDPWGIGG